MTEPSTPQPNEQATTAADLDRPEGPDALEEAQRSDEFRDAVGENASEGSAGSDGGPDGAQGESSVDPGLGLVDRPGVPRD